MNILWIPHAPWRTPQRARFFAEALAPHHNVHVTDWDAEFRRPADFLSARYLHNFQGRRWNERGVTVHHVPRISPALFSRRLRRVNTHWFQEHLARVIDREQIEVVVGCFVAPVPSGPAIVTDIFDDNVAYWAAYGVNKAYGQEIAASETAWIAASQAVTTVSSMLAERVGERYPGHRVTHVPNCVDLTRYVPDRAAARAALGLRPGGVYVGNIGALDKPVEVQRLLEVARRLRVRPDAQLLVAGRGDGMRALQQRAADEGLDNVRFMGFMSGEPLVQLFQALDVGLCPYRATQGAQVSVPMRLLHYSAVGAAVVCPDLLEVRRMAFDNVLLTEDDDFAFADGVLAALDWSGKVPAAIKRYDQRAVTAQYEQILRGAVAGAAGGP